MGRFVASVLGRSVLLFLFVGLSGCAVVMPTVTAKYPRDRENKDIVSAAVVVLQQYDFSVTVVEPDMGLIVTDWRAATTPGEETATAILSAIAYSPLHPSYGDSGRQRIKLTLTIDKAAHKIVLKPNKQGSTKVRGWFEVNLDDGDKRLLQKIAERIVRRIGGRTASIEWDDPLEREQEMQASEDGVDPSIVAAVVVVLLVVILAAKNSDS